MAKKNKDRIGFLLAGILTGFAVTGIGVYIFYNNKKYLEEVKQTTRYDVKAPTVPSKEGFQIFIVSSLDKIFKDGKTLLKPNFSELANLSSAKNEYESFQVVVKSGQEALKSVQPEISDLINAETGAKIDKGNLTWRVVGYVPTKKPYYPVKYVGFWPDPLLPFNNMDIQPNVTQPFWVTVYVPKDVVPGNYQGTIIVTFEGTHSREIPIKLHVYDFILPLESHLKTAFDFYGHVTHSRYPQEGNESQETYQSRINKLNDKFIIEMLKYRMNPILNIDPTSESDLGRVDRYRVFGLNNFAIGKIGGTFNNNWPKNDREIENLFDLYRTYGEMLKLNRMLQHTYIYTWDEGEMGNSWVAKISSMIHRAYPGLKNMVCYQGIWDPDQDPQWLKDIDIWTFQIDKFNENKIAKLKSAGKEIWMYISGPGGTGSPNLAIDFDSMDYRIIPWMCWKYDIKGFLYWCVNWWPLVNPFKSAANTKWEQNGNGLLFYPGANGPLDSLRTEVFRDGMEDYEYFYLLKEGRQSLLSKTFVGEEESKAKGLLRKSEQLLEIDQSIVNSIFEFTKNEKILKDRRNDIAQTIVEINKLLTAPGH